MAKTLPVPDTRPASQLVGETLASIDSLNDRIAKGEELLSQLKAHRKYLAEHVLVELVHHEQLNDGCTLPDGRVVTFERKVNATVPAPLRKEAHDWLVANGHGDLLKTHVCVSFPKDHHAVATALAELAKSLPNAEVEVTTELPGPTLTSFVTKALAFGRALPPSITYYAPLRAVER
jgi:hypothetical protein